MGRERLSYGNPMSIRRVLFAVCAMLAFSAGGLAAYVASGQEQPSVCYGDAASGRLERGSRLPYSGENYRAYSVLGFALGRTYVHSSVRDVMRDAYAELAKSRPELRFIYGESGWARGGRFRPHKGHTNGTAADFFVPVRTLEGNVSQLPTSPFNLFGYAIQFDLGRKVSRVGAVTWGLWPALRFPPPLIKPSVPISGTRLSDWLHHKAHDGRPLYAGVQR
jgi:hypothetical protein